MSAERLLYAMGDIRGEFIQEAAPAGVPRRRRWPWAAALAACLCLVLLMARTRPASPAESGVDASGGGPIGCAPFPGEISQPLLYWQGTAYAWNRVGAPGRPIGEPPETIAQWTELGPRCPAPSTRTRRATPASSMC